MAYIESDLTEIEAAIKLGARRVKYHDHETEFHSVEEMIAARNHIRKELYNAARPSTAGCIPTCTAIFDDA